MPQNKTQILTRALRNGIDWTGTMPANIVGDGGFQIPLGDVDYSDSGLSVFLRLEYSDDGGTTWHLVIEGTWVGGHEPMWNGVPLGGLLIGVGDVKRLEGKLIHVVVQPNRDCEMGLNSDVNQV